MKPVLSEEIDLLKFQYNKSILHRETCVILWVHGTTPTEKPVLSCEYMVPLLQRNLCYLVSTWYHSYRETCLILWVHGTTPTEKPVLSCEYMVLLLQRNLSYLVSTWYHSYRETCLILWVHGTTPTKCSLSRVLHYTEKEELWWLRSVLLRDVSEDSYNSINQYNITMTNMPRCKVYRQKYTVQLNCRLRDVSLILVYELCSLLKMLLWQWNVKQE